MVPTRARAVAYAWRFEWKVDEQGGRRFMVQLVPIEPSCPRNRSLTAGRLEVRRCTCAVAVSRSERHSDWPFPPTMGRATRTLMNTRSLGIAVVFVAGCAVGGASARFVVPPANAQQAATLTKWEYLCPAMRFDAVTAPANKAGAEGWELVNYDPQSGIGCFKRPKM